MGCGRALEVEVEVEVEAEVASAGTLGEKVTVGVMGPRGGEGRGPCIGA
jgi:hypothetical protein